MAMNYFKIVLCCAVAAVVTPQVAESAPAIPKVLVAS